MPKAIIPVAQDHRNPVNRAECEQYGVSCRAGSNGTMELTGAYENLLDYMTTVLMMSDSEADIEIGDEEDFDHNEDYFRDAQQDWDDVRNDAGEPFSDQREPYDALDYYEEDVMAADYSAAAAEDEEDLQSARTTGSGRPFEGKMSLKSLLSEGPTTVEVGDKVDIWTTYMGTVPVRVIELVDDVIQATGNEIRPEDPDHDHEFSGPGFVGEMDPESGESGQLVFSLNQIVPGSKEEYEALMDDDPYMNPTNYDRDQGDDPSFSDYFDAEDEKTAVPWRAAPFSRGTGYSEGKQMKESTSRHNVANDYAYRQIRGSLQRRGAEVTVSPDGLTVTGRFSDPNDAHVAWLALGEKYPNSGPNAVYAVKSGMTLEFRFQAIQEATSFDRFMDRIVIQESHEANRKLNVVTDSPQRQRALRFQDRPANKTKWSK